MCIRDSYMFDELERLLYKERDELPWALESYDATCRQHNAEMSTIRPLLVEKLGAIPLLSTYKQMAIRQQKAHDFETALWWAERGLALYETDAANQIWVDDLRGRADKYRTKIAAP